VTTPLPGRARTTTSTDASGDAATTSSGLELHRWRRLDWRFLVPTVGWTRVACGGAVDDELRAALPLLGADLHEASSASDWRALSGSCDVVVLVHPTPDDLRWAVTATRPGGWVYAEVRRATTWTRPRSLLGWHSALRRAGLEDVSAHWHDPDPQNAKQIVPVDVRAAVRHAMLSNRGPRGGLRNTVGRVLLTAGLFPLAVPAGSVLGRRPGGNA
jgi:hypothetical protein